MVRPDVKRKRLEMAEAVVKSRKERKKLEKIVMRKRHKVDRSNILAELKKVQLNSDQIDRLHSTTSMQTRGLKRFTSDDAEPGRYFLQPGMNQAEQCLDPTLLIRKKRRKIRPAKNLAQNSSSSSEDTDAVSTDTESQSKECVGGLKNTKHPDDISSLKKSQSQDDDKNNTLESNKTVQQASLLPNTETSFTDVAKPKFKKSEPAIYVEVARDPDVEKARLELPIIGEEQRIMEEIRYNDVVVVSGETGSGKTTQIPQFLYEAGYALNEKIIGITEPRRVAAVTMSERVAYELNLQGGEVAYQIRFAGTSSEKTRIKFMTDGVLLKECQQDFLLSKYSVLIIDEAHERSVFSDILIGLLSRIVPLRAKKADPLKLVIMSATLRVTDFTENTFLFPKTPPIIKIDARQYPVTTQFSKSTPDDYLEAAYKKVSSIHAKLPRGGILVFVTSQMDVKVLSKKLKTRSGLYCLGLYAMLPIEKQQLVFKEPPEGTRLCVIATNVAETSITIPNIKYVVDTGMEKRKQYNMVTGVSRFITTWTSKSSAEQRAGRAGRMGPGYCYRLYSSAVYTNDFSEFSEPQILQKPVEDVLLQLKTMNVDNVVNFPFPTKPPIEALKIAEKKLIRLGALDDSLSKNAFTTDITKTEFASRPTELGKTMAKFAVSARCSKMIVLAPTKLLPHVISLVSAMTVREMFVNDLQFKESRKKWAGRGNAKLLGDYMIMLRAIIDAESSECMEKLCQECGLRPRAFIEISKLRRHLTNDINSKLSHAEIDDKKRLKKPSEAKCKMLRQLLYSSFCDQVAKRIPEGEVQIPGHGDQSIKKKLKNAYECEGKDEPVYISAESVLKGQNPEFLIYKELYKGDKKTYMRDVAVIDPEWLPTV